MEFVKVCVIGLVAVLSMSSGLTVLYRDGNETKTQEFLSPDMEVTGTPTPFEVTSGLFLPTDGMHGCSDDSMVGTSGKIVVVDTLVCSTSQKIRNAYHRGAVGMIIQWSDSTVPGADYKWASLGISKVNLPTVELLQSDGQQLIDLISGVNGTVTIRSGEYNEWKAVFESVTFIVLFVVVQTVYQSVILLMAIYRFVRMFKVERSRGTTITRILLGFVPSYVLYVTIFGCLFALMYVAVDPFHSRGIYNRMEDAIFISFSFPSCFVGEFLLIFSLYVLVSPDSKSLRGAMSVRKSILIMLGFSLTVLLLDMGSSINRGVYQDNGTYIIVAGALYIVAPLVIIGLLLFVLIKFRRFTASSTAPSVNGGSTKMTRISYRLKVVAMILIPVYIGWLIITVVSVTSQIQRPKVRVTTFFFWFILTGVIHLVNIYFIPIRKESTSTLSSSKSSKSVETGSGIEPLPEPPSDSMELPELEVEIKVESNVSDVY